MTHNFTEGKPLKSILLFSVPVLLGNLFQLAYNMVDTIIVGRYLGEDALAAVGSTGPLIGVILGFALGTSQGFGILVSQAFGANKPEKLKHCVAVSLLLTLFISVILTLITLCGTRQLLIWTNTPENIFKLTQDYVSIIFAGILTTMAYNVGASILRGIGDSKTPLYFLIFSSFLNLALDILLIVYIPLSTAGAAYATVISTAISAILCFWYMFKKYELLRFTKEEAYLDVPTVKSLLSMGVPMALSHSITQTGTVILQGAVNSFGSCVVAAYTAAFKVTGVSSQTFSTLSTAMSTYCAQNIGAKKYDRIYDGMRIGLMLTVASSILAFLIHVLGGEFIVRLFVTNPTEELIHYANIYININSWFMFPLALIYLYRFALQGLGNGVIPILNGFTEMVSRYIASLVLTGPFGYVGVCFVNPITYTVSAIVVVIAYIQWEKQSKCKNKCSSS